MSDGKLSLRKMLPVIVITWVLSLITTLALVYFTPYLPIGTDKIQDSAVTSGKIADNAIITMKLADGSVTSAKIVDGTIIAQDIADGSIISVKIADGAITSTKLADGAVTADKIADSAIVTLKLADGAVTSAKILDGTITTVDLADGSVTSVKIADNSITTTKIADYAVTDQKLAADAIPVTTRSVLTENSTTSSLYEDMPGTNVTITLNRASHLIILFSSRMWLDTPNQEVSIRALTNGDYTSPGEYSAVPPQNLCDSRTYHFYTPVGAGTHSIRMQWAVTAGEVFAGERLLTVIALPA